ncbi:hypothetical protein Mapa_001333 [Marchantia paleacea]|nr:hypothetical protein Mapa_001333 [Marchantia paleacea]
MGNQGKNGLPEVGKYRTGGIRFASFSAGWTFRRVELCRTGFCLAKTHTADFRRQHTPDYLIRCLYISLCFLGFDALLVSLLRSHLQVRS